MLILPPGHAESIRLDRRLSVRERRLVAGAIAVVAALTVVLAISLGSTAPRSAAGCIHVTIPAATGAQYIDECGVQAHNTCATVRMAGAFTAQAEPVVETACRQANLAVGP